MWVGGKGVQSRFAEVSSIRVKYLLMWTDRAQGEIRWWIKSRMVADASALNEKKNEGNEFCGRDPLCRLNLRPPKKHNMASFRFNTCITEQNSKEQVKKKDKEEDRKLCL